MYKKPITVLIYNRQRLLNLERASLIKLINTVNWLGT
jgi:hypothetical protein